MTLILWSFQSKGGELFAVSSGRTPPSAFTELIKDWKWLKDGIASTEEAIGRITLDNPRVILADVERQGYHLFETKLLRPDWVRPFDT
jgi:hypothetical protein